MLKADIVEGVYLKQTIERYGLPAGLIGVVHKVGTDWTGEWMFQLHYLNPPGGMRKKPVPPWSLNLRETDLVGFEVIGTWFCWHLPIQPNQRKSRGFRGCPQ